MHVQLSAYMHNSSQSNLGCCWWCYGCMWPLVVCVCDDRCVIVCIDCEKFSSAICLLRYFFPSSLFCRVTLFMNPRIQSDIVLSVEAMKQQLCSEERGCPSACNMNLLIGWLRMVCHIVLPPAHLWGYMILVIFSLFWTTSYHIDCLRDWYDFSLIEDDPPSQHGHLMNRRPMQYLPMHVLQLGQSEEWTRRPTN